MAPRFPFPPARLRCNHPPKRSILSQSAAEKEALRRAGLAARDSLDHAYRESASRRIAQRVLALPVFDAAHAQRRIVAGYAPIRSEVDTFALLDALAQRGFTLALPLVRDPRLVFLRWRPGEELIRGAFGVSAPSEESGVLVPDILLMPLSRFDRARNRIGYGKGHYDRAIAGLTQEKPVITIGLAFDIQATESIPAEPHDRRLDFVVTETETLSD